jgi:hypothetical protein
LFLLLLKNGFALLKAEVNDKSLMDSTYTKRLTHAPQAQNSETELHKQDFYAFTPLYWGAGIAQSV